MADAARASPSTARPGITATVSVSMFGVAPVEAKLAELRDHGVYRAIVGLPAAGRDQVLPLLDTYVALARKVG